MFEYLSTLFSEPLAFFDQAIFRTLAVLIGLCCHEWGHAYVAYRCGDDTAKRAGRLTLNPLRHLDPVGTILMFFVGFGYAKPVPVNPYHFRGDRNRDDFLVSIAGITVNLILFVFFTYLAVLCSAFMWDKQFIAHNGLSKVVSYEYNAVWSVIAGTARQDFGAVIAQSWLVPFVRLSAYTALVNLNLAVFNLIPLPPLEFDVLAVLMKNKNRTVSRERILNEIWGQDYFGDIRTVDVRIANLRKKLNLSEEIRTISKAGYRLEER